MNILWTVLKMRTDFMFPSCAVRFAGPGLKRSHPGSESRSNKPPEPVISQIIDKLKHINQVSCVHVPSRFPSLCPWEFFWVITFNKQFLCAHKWSSPLWRPEGLPYPLILPLWSRLDIDLWTTAGLALRLLRGSAQDRLRCEMKMLCAVFKVMSVPCSL